MTDTTDTTTDRVRDAARLTFRNHLEYLSSGRIPEWVELFADEGVLEFPYGPEGFPKAVTGKAVKVRIVIAGLGMPEGVSVLDTVHLLRVDGRWRWILPPERFERYAQDRC